MVFPVIVNKNVKKFHEGTIYNPKVETRKWREELERKINRRKILTQKMSKHNKQVKTATKVRRKIKK